LQSTTQYFGKGQRFVKKLNDFFSELNEFFFENSMEFVFFSKLNEISPKLHLTGKSVCSPLQNFSEKTSLIYFCKIMPQAGSHFFLHSGQKLTILSV